MWSIFPINGILFLVINFTLPGKWHCVDSLLGTRNIHADIWDYLSFISTWYMTWFMQMQWTETMPFILRYVIHSTITGAEAGDSLSQVLVNDFAFSIHDALTFEYLFRRMQRRSWGIEETVSPQILKGRKGQTGFPGERGLKGESGEKGSKGAPGDQGPSPGLSKGEGI